MALTLLLHSWFYHEDLRIKATNEKTFGIYECYACLRKELIVSRRVIAACRASSAKERVFPA